MGHHAEMPRLPSERNHAYSRAVQYPSRVPKGFSYLRGSQEPMGSFKMQEARYTKGLSHCSDIAEQARDRLRTGYQDWKHTMTTMIRISYKRTAAVFVRITPAPMFWSNTMSQAKRPSILFLISAL